MMKRFRALVSAALLVATAAALSPASPLAQDAGSAPKQKPIVIGVAGPFTGPSAQFGVQIRYGVTLAQEEINAAGGINGRSVELTFEDDAATQSEANKVALKLASNKDIVAVIGHFNSSCSLAARGIYKDAGIVMFTPASTNANVTRGHPNVFRNIFNDNFQGHCVARLAKEILNSSRVAILYDNDDYGRGLYEAFREKADAIGLRVVADQAYDRDTTDFRPQLQAIARRRPEALIVGGLYQEAALIARQASELGMAIPIIGSDGVFSGKFIELAGSTAEGARVTTAFVFDESDPAAMDFARRVKERFDAEPDTWAAQSYDALRLLAQAIGEVGSDRAAIREKLATMTSVDKGFKGLTGLTYFDAQGDCVKPVVVAIVRDGKFRLNDKQLAPEDPAPAAEAAVVEAPGELTLEVEVVPAGE
jgi:branched-chain amino acid transport system substrate-binding protein